MNDTSVSSPKEPSAFNLNYYNFTVRVDPNPLTKSAFGSLIVTHNKTKKFTRYDRNDLYELANLKQQILSIFKQNGVDNALILGEQKPEGFTLRIVPYPKCNWIEKIKGLVYFFFGAPTLKEQELHRIEEFYKQQFKQISPPKLATIPSSKEHVEKTGCLLSKRSH